MCVGPDPALSPVLRIPVACHELHPGLCRTTHEHLFDEALAFAKQLHRKLCGMDLGAFIGFHTFGFSNVFCVAARRLKDPPLHVLAECSLRAARCEDEPDVLYMAVQDGELVFQTVYSVAFDLCAASAPMRHEIAMTEFDVESDLSTPLAVIINGRRHTMLHEGINPCRDGLGVGRHHKDVASDGIGGGDLPGRSGAAASLVGTDFLKHLDQARDG